MRKPTDLRAQDQGVGASQVMTLYGQTMTRTGSIFALGLASVVPFGILSIAVTTRYLVPLEYGHLAVLFAIASFVTMFCGVGFLQGTMITVYGIADDGDEDGDGDLDGFGVSDVRDVTLADAAAGTAEKKRLLGSGLLIVVATTSVLCALVGLVGAPLAAALFGSGWTGPILWMAASAWAGGLWRLMHQIPRMERHPIRWAALQWARPALVVIGTWLALAAGLGVSGVLMATAIGTILATAIAFVLSRHSVRLAPRRGDLATLWKAGRAWVPLIFAVAVQTNVSVLLLGILATPASVGLFQVATRISQFPIYFADGFVTAWPAMERSPISLAAKEKKGLREYSAAAFTLLALTTLALLVMVSLFADALIHIAAPSYRSAASLIPIVAAGAAAHVAFRGVFRATGFSKRRYWYTFLHLLWIAPYAAAAALLVPLNASYGIALAQLAAGVVVTACFVLLDKRSPVTTPFQWRRLGVALLAACLCVAVAQLIPAQGLVRAALSIAAFAAFPLLLIVTRAIPSQQVATIAAIIGSVVPRRISRASAYRRLAAIPVNERRALWLVTSERRDPRAAAQLLEVPESVLFARVARGLRQFGDTEGKPTPFDHMIGRWVLHSGSTIEQDVLAAHLRALGINPLELHLLDNAVRTVTKVGRGAKVEFRA
ncbi:MAG TPA: oligosaccharide flippase family protein [Solirubrobacterales bacterium]